MHVSKAVLITGCSSGIGYATAERLADVGWKVYATARDVEKITPLEGHGCMLLPLDVSVEAVPMEKVRGQFETNVFGLVRMCQLVLPGMRRQGYGRIVNVSSMGGKLTFPGAGYYHATKHAVEALSDALRFEVEGFGIKVCVIEPGLIKTGFADAAVDSMDGPQDGPYAGFDEAVARATVENYERGPFARLGGGPEAVAEAIDHAVSVRSPRSRCAVTPSAHLFLRLRRLLPDRAWDAALRTIYPQPGR